MGTKLTSDLLRGSQECFAAKLGTDSRQRVATNLIIAYFPAEETITLELPQKGIVMSDQTFVTTITKFKSKLGAEAKLIAALKNFDNSNSKSWQVISVGENVYAAINTYQSIEDRTEDVVAGMEWLDSISHLLEYFEDGSRTEAFSGIVLHQG